jgi:hypothetical protein
MMKKVRINSIDDLIAKFNSHANHFVYRGHADAAWPLQSSLERVIGSAWSAALARTYEDRSLYSFQTKFHLYDYENVAPNSKLAWLAIMQHYGVPTRLVDFTVSPYVALYFALETYQPSTKSDLAVFALDSTAIMEASIAHIKSKDSSFKETRQSISEHEDEIFDNVVDRFAYETVWITEPLRHNARLDRQGGCFVISGNREMRIADVLELDRYKRCEFIKYEIAASLYPAIFALLRKMNVTSKSLYGDLDGLARSIRMELQVYATAPSPIVN